MGFVLGPVWVLISLPLPGCDEQYMASPLWAPVSFVKWTF